MASRTPARRATPRASDEETPLLGAAPGKSSALREHLAADVSKRWADVVLLFCYVITGLLDSSAVFIWGSFVSMQTGGQRLASAAANMLTPRQETRSILAWASSRRTRASAGSRRARR